MNSEQGTMGNVLGNGRRALAEEVPVGYKRTEVGVIPQDWRCIGYRYRAFRVQLGKNGIDAAKQDSGVPKPYIRAIVHVQWGSEST